MVFFALLNFASFRVTLFAFPLIYTVPNILQLYLLEQADVPHKMDLEDYRKNMVGLLFVTTTAYLIHHYMGQRTMAQLVINRNANRAQQSFLIKRLEQYRLAAVFAFDRRGKNIYSLGLAQELNIKPEDAVFKFRNDLSDAPLGQFSVLDCLKRPAEHYIGR